MILIPHIADTNKEYKLSSLANTSIYQQVYGLFVNLVCLLVYRCISHYCIFYHDRPVSWY